MRRFGSVAVLVLTIGGIGSIVGIGGSVLALSSATDWTVTAAVTGSALIGISVLCTGAIWVRGDDTTSDLHRRIPAGTLVGLGTVVPIVVAISYRPWEFGGLAGGFRTLVVGLTVGIGLVVTTAGSKWYRLREIAYPLAVLSGLLLCGITAFSLGLWGSGFAVGHLLLLAFALTVLPCLVIRLTRRDDPDRNE